MQLGSFTITALPIKCIVKDCTNDAEGHYEVKSVLWKRKRKAGICKKHRRKGGSFIRWYDILKIK